MYFGNILTPGFYLFIYLFIKSKQQRGHCCVAACRGDLYVLVESSHISRLRKELMLMLAAGFDFD